MKKHFYLITVIILFCFGCTGIKTASYGLENEAFIEVVGPPENYAGGVRVNLDDKIDFNAEVIKEHIDYPKGKIYAISTGNHLLTIYYGSKIIYRKNIFASSQETKKIALP